jgi:hypothetical protein
MVENMSPLEYLEWPNHSDLEEAAVYVDVVDERVDSAVEGDADSNWDEDP